MLEPYSPERNDTFRGRGPGTTPLSSTLSAGTGIGGGFAILQARRHVPITYENT